MHVEAIQYRHFKVLSNAMAVHEQSTALEYRYSTVA